jgi:hypothetical protein
MVELADIALGIGAAFLAILLYVSFLTLWRHGRRFNEAFRELGRRRGGRARTRLLRFPSAVMALADNFASVGGAYATQYSSNLVEVEIAARRPWPGRLAVHPPGYHAAILSLFRAGRTRTGDPAFDRAFVLFGSPPEIAEAILDAESREGITNATVLGRRGDVVLIVHPTALRLRKYNVTPDPDVLEALLATAETVYRKVEALRKGNLEIEYLRSRDSALPGSCPVCGSELDRDPVRCRTCRTPHHRDCWRYNRGCATFACGERKFTKKIQS